MHGFEGFFLTGMGGVAAIVIVLVMNYVDRKRSERAGKRPPQA